jgi:hypothetical protein
MFKSLIQFSATIIVFWKDRQYTLVALGIQHAMRMSHSFICCLVCVQVYNIIPNNLKSSTIFKTNSPNIKCVFRVSPCNFLKYFSFQEELSEIWSKMYVVLNVNDPLFWFIFMKLDFLYRFSKNSKIFFIPRRTERDMTENVCWS